MSDSIYCPFCKRDIEPELDDDGVEIGLSAGARVYVHDDIEHDPDYKFEGLQ